MMSCKLPDTGMVADRLYVMGRSQFVVFDAFMESAQEHL